jgi:hypothetical protein
VKTEKFGKQEFLSDFSWRCVEVELSDLGYKDSWGNLNNIPFEG